MVESRQGGNKEKEKGKMYVTGLDKLKMKEGMCQIRYWETEMYWIKNEVTRQIRVKIVTKNKKLQKGKHRVIFPVILEVITVFQSCSAQ